MSTWIGTFEGLAYLSAARGNKRRLAALPERDI